VLRGAGVAAMIASTSPRGGSVSEIARFSLGEGGGEVLVEVDEPVSGIRRAAGRDQDGLLRATAKLDDALATIVPTAQRLLDAVRGMAPKGGQVEFGIKLSVEAGALIAKTGGEANFSVTLMWGE
jgi:hypothetical protein